MCLQRPQTWLPITVAQQTPDPRIAPAHGSATGSRPATHHEAGNQTLIEGLKLVRITAYVALYPVCQ